MGKRSCYAILTSALLVVIVITGYAQSVSINMNAEHQRIAGFGGMNHPYWIRDLTPDMVDKVFGNQPGQLGLSILRTYIHEDRSQWSRVVPTALRARDHGAIIFASPWTAPTHMKSNRSLVGGELLLEHYGAYADYLLDFVSYMEESGAPLYAVSIINEPDIDVTYQSMRWAPQGMVDFLREQGPKFDSIKLIAAESFNFNHSITNPILNDPLAEQHVDIIGGHIYGGGLVDYPLARNKGKEVWMTEYLTNSDIPNSANIWTHALSFASIVNRCLATANFNAFVWWYIRRFYSLIDDAGNITKRGYTMSQFSKFIRPGDVRVGVTATSLPNVELSAFKSDTSLTIVVINRNTQNVAINFSIENGSVDTLAQFTTSEFKNVRNEGYITALGNTFTASVDASSVTTLTTRFTKGERQGNLPPVAVAGENINIVDNGLIGIIPFELNALSSTDPDGTIVNYSWSRDGSQIAWEPTHSLTLGYGVGTFVLAVTDNDGSRDTDTLVVTVSGLGNDHFWFDAECAQVGTNWDTHDGENTANGKYVMMNPDIAESLNSPSLIADDHLVFTFNVSKAGGYKVWGRVNAPTFNDDSFWVRMNDGEWARWNGIRSSSDTWHWKDVHDDVDGSLEGIQYYLTTGTHTLTITHRENGAGLDMIYITNSGLTPADLGEASTNCPPIPNNIGGLKGNKLSVYPNPAHSGVHVSWEELFTQLEVISLDGRTMLREDYSAPLSRKFLALRLESGFYILRVSNGKSMANIRIVVH